MCQEIAKRTALFALIILTCSFKSDKKVISKNIIEFSEFETEQSVSFDKLFDYVKGVPGNYYLLDSIMVIFNRDRASEYVFYNYNFPLSHKSRHFLLTHKPRFVLLIHKPRSKKIEPNNISHTHS